MIRALRPEDLDQVMQIWLDANLEAHCFLPESYWCDHMEEVRRRCPPPRCSSIRTGRGSRALRD